MIILATMKMTILETMMIMLAKTTSAKEQIEEDNGNTNSPLIQRNKARKASKNNVTLPILTSSLPFVLCAALMILMMRIVILGLGCF